MVCLFRIIELYLFRIKISAIFFGGKFKINERHCCFKDCLLQKSKKPKQRIAVLMNWKQCESSLFVHIFNFEKHGFMLCTD